MKTRTAMAAILMLAMAAVLEISPALAQEKNPERNAYFGQTHQHTSWSPDAYIFGNTVTGPEEAYQYSIGLPIKHPAGFMVQIRTPLDFEGVTDHAEYVGVMRLANDPSSSLSKLPVAKKLQIKNQAQATEVFQWLAKSLGTGQPIKELLSPDITENIWKQTIAAADKYNKPGKFTAFVSYEWTSMPNNRNMHRNVFFRDSVHVPVAPFTSIDSQHPEDLWAWMDVQRKAGNELLCISHNANLSDGLMFPIDVDSKGRPIDAAWAADRLNNEVLTEIKQVKGTSETTPELSPTDEFASFELMNYLIGLDNSHSNPHGSYAREAYRNGLAMQDTRGYNPYKFGFVGAGDAHNTASAYSQSNYFGDHAMIDPTPEIRLAGKVVSGMTIIQTGTSGLGGVWAEENTRASIFDAMKRKETFGTSGVRIRGATVRGLGLPSGCSELEGLGKNRLYKRRSDGRRPSGEKRRGGADIHCLGGKRPQRWQSRPHSNHQGLEQEWPDFRENLRCGLVRRSQARSADRESPGGREHSGCQECELDEYHRRGGTEKGLDRPRFRSHAERVLLCARDSDSDSAMEHLRRQEVGSGAAHNRPLFDSRTCVELTDLVHADKTGCSSRY